MKNVKGLVLLTVLWVLSACGGLVDTSTEQQEVISGNGGTLKLSINPGIPANQGISVEEFTVISVDVALIDIATSLTVQTLTWYAVQGQTTFNVAVGTPGDFKVLVTHHGTNVNSSKAMSESVNVQIKPMLITVINLVPGYIGTIDVKDVPAVQYLYVANADFSRNTTGTAFPNNWTNLSTWNAPVYLAVNDGHYGVVNFNQSVNGGQGMTQILPSALPLTKVHTLTLDFKIVSASLTGDGWYATSPEAPMVVTLTFTKSGAPNYYFQRFYNYTHDSDSPSNPNFELVAQNSWITKTYTTTMMGIPSGYAFKSISVGSSGHSRNTYVDKALFE